MASETASAKDLCQRMHFNLMFASRVSSSPREIRRIETETKDIEDTFTVTLANGKVIRVTVAEEQ